MTDALGDLISELEEAGDDEATVEIAAVALAEGDASPHGLVDLLGHGCAAVRRAAALALGRRGDGAARAALERALEDASGPVRRASCRALSQLGDPRSEPAVARLLADRLPSVRAAAAEALRGTGGEEAVARLDALLGDERARAPRAAAFDSLVALGGRDAAHAEAALGALVRHVPREDDPELRRAAAGRLLAATAHRDHGALLTLFRQVPRSGQQPLADALAEHALTPAQARIAQELRHLPADVEVLARFGSNLTERALTGELGRAHGREAELQTIRERFARPGPKSLVLIGPSGVGKTALVHELARRLGEEQVLVPTTILEATTGEVLSGTRYLGEWQTRLKELIDALKAPSRTVWYVPDVNLLAEAGTSEHSQESFASMLAPALERGNVVILGESTPEAWRRGLSRFPGLRKLFFTLELEVPAPVAAREILARVADDLRQQHASRVDLVVPATSVELALDLADDYFTSQVRPGDGVRLLREAVEAAVQQAAPEAHGPGAPPPRVEVPPTHLLATLSHLSGVPVRLLDDVLPLDLGEVRRFFAERVLGQDEAVETVVDLISLIKAGLTDPARPLGVLFFAGPTGVGKTEMAKAMAEFLFGSPERLVRVDLGEFREPHSLRRLVGDPHALDPAARSGLLTAPVRERPFSVVLLDEVEKAHSNVFDLLLPLMDEGRLVDERGQVTDFRRAIIIMTSNLGSDLTEGTDLGFASSEGELEAQTAKVRRAMRKTFRPEFLNRLTRTVVFAPLSLEVMRRLTRREVRRVLSRKGITRRHVIVETDDAVIGILLEEGFSSTFGARHLKRRVEELLLKPLARAILRLPPTATLAEPALGEEQPVIRLAVAEDGALLSEIVQQPTEEADEAEAPAPGRATARIKDPRLGRLVDLDDLEQRVLELQERVDGITEALEAQGLRLRKRELLDATLAAGFWEDKARAGVILSEISALERLLDAPGHLEKAVAKLDRILGSARRQPGETRTLHDLLARIDGLEHEIEFTTYAVHCPSPEDRGDAYLLLRQVGDGDLPVDPIASMSRLYRRYLRGKRLAYQVVYEAVRGGGTLREAGIRVEGTCAFGLLAGEAGLHQWIDRDPDQRHGKLTAFVRVNVFPPAPEPLRPAEIKLERRPTQDEAGVLIKRHRQHLVVTHQETLVAVDGSVDGHPKAEEGALTFLAARVAQARRRGGQSDPGVVRRYVLSHQVARDLGTGTKLHLDQVLAGKLDAFVLPRVLGHRVE